MIKVPAEILRRAYRRRPLHVPKMLALWSLILGLGALATWGTRQSRYGVLIAVVAGVIAGNLVRGLGSITHDAAHGLVAKSRGGVYVIGCLSWLPSFMSFTLYRSYHLDHHRIVNMPHDTDRVQTSRMTSNPTLARWLRMVIFTSAYPVYWALRVGRHYRVLSPWRKVRVWGELVVGYGVLFALRSVMGPVAWWAFFLAMVVTSFVLASLTTMLEHYEVDYDRDPAYSSRTYGTRSRVLDWMWGSSTYHIEHHGFPGIPCYNLRRFHREVLPHYPPALRRNVHESMLGVLFPLLGRLWRMDLEEERARARRDEAGLSAVSNLDGFVARRGLGTSGGDEVGEEQSVAA